MKPLDHAIQDFLSSPSIAVAGVSRNPNKTGNAIYRRLKTTGSRIHAVNPHADRVEGGDPCYPDLASIPGGVDAVFLATSQAATVQLVEQCRALGIRRVWMHRGFGPGSVAPEAVRVCRENGIQVIAGACPLMYCPPVDIFHRCMRGIMGWTGGLPKV